MSRSYKKTPCLTEQSSRRQFMKRKASKTVRSKVKQELHALEMNDVQTAEKLSLENDGDFKRTFESWEIEDYKGVVFENDDLVDGYWEKAKRK
ncbi:MAG: hypothetical protein ACOC22_01740 [bacterium]